MSTVDPTLKKNADMASCRPNFSGIYSLKSSENEDAFLKAQGVGWVLRKAAKAVGSKRVVIGNCVPVYWTVSSFLIALLLAPRVAD